MEIIIDYLENKLKLSYNDVGILDTVFNMKTKEYMLIESKLNGTGIKIKEESFMIGGKSNVCDARYVLIKDLDIFVPKYIIIPNKKL
jgi:hypothetical protein